MCMPLVRLEMLTSRGWDVAAKLVLTACERCLGFPTGTLARGEDPFPHVMHVP